MMGYYRRFVRKYRDIVAPITKLLQNNAFKWSEEATSTFEIRKRAMIVVPIMAFPTSVLPFVIEIDTSGFGLGLS